MTTDTANVTNVANVPKAANIFEALISKLEKHLPWLSVVFLLMGIWFAKQSLLFAQLIDKGMSIFIDSYGYFAPVAIYMILTPTLTKLLASSGNSGKRFANFTI